MSIKAMCPPGPTPPEICPATSNSKKDNGDKAPPNNSKLKTSKPNSSKDKPKPKGKKMEDYKSFSKMKKAKEPLKMQVLTTSMPTWMQIPKRKSLNLESRMNSNPTTIILSPKTKIPSLSWRKINKKRGGEWNQMTMIPMMMTVSSCFVSTRRSRSSDRDNNCAGYDILLT